MTAVINGVQVTGTPEEIAKLMAITRVITTATKPYTTGLGTATSAQTKAKI